MTIWRDDTLKHQATLREENPKPTRMQDGILSTAPHYNAIISECSCAVQLTHVEPTLVTDSENALHHRDDLTPAV
jgi:hypothetical protein